MRYSMYERIEVLKKLHLIVIAKVKVFRPQPRSKPVTIREVTSCAIYVARAVNSF